jgi:hypothetical protein
MLSRDVIYELRRLRDGGYIRGFMADGDRCTILLDGSNISASESDLRQIIPTIKSRALSRSDVQR